jgi:signal-transduction protein with cAMP-binding, CBS, and nucleotidyltransferase domain
MVRVSTMKKVTGDETKPSAGIAGVGSNGSERGSSLFAGLKEEEVAEILDAATMRRFAKGQTIVRQNDRQTYLGLIKQGSVNVFAKRLHGKLLITQLLQGDAYGLGTLIPGSYTYSLSGEADEETEIYAWDAVKARRLAKRVPRLVVNAIFITLERVERYSVEHLALISAENRITQELLRAGQWTAKPATDKNSTALARRYQHG